MPWAARRPACFSSVGMRRRLGRVDQELLQLKSCHSALLILVFYARIRYASTPGADVFNPRPRRGRPPKRKRRYSRARRWSPSLSLFNAGHRAPLGPASPQGYSQGAAGLRRRRPLGRKRHRLEAARELRWSTAPGRGGAGRRSAGASARTRAPAHGRGRRRRFRPPHGPPTSRGGRGKQEEPQVDFCSHGAPLKRQGRAVRDRGASVMAHVKWPFEVTAYVFASTGRG